MARVTVEDCLDNVDNRFELVLLASRRARQLAMTSQSSLVEENDDKPTVLALREIAAGKMNFATLESLEQQSHVDLNATTDEII